MVGVCRVSVMCQVAVVLDLDRLVDLVHRSPHLVSFFPHGLEPACQLAISDQGLAWS